MAGRGSSDLPVIDTHGYGFTVLVEPLRRAGELLGWTLTGTRDALGPGNVTEFRSPRQVAVAELRGTRRSVQPRSLASCDRLPRYRRRARCHVMPR
jgi:hypothetical protein